MTIQQFGRWSLLVPRALQYPHDSTQYNEISKDDSSYIWSSGDAVIWNFLLNSLEKKTEVEAEEIIKEFRNSLGLAWIQSNGISPLLPSTRAAYPAKLGVRSEEEDLPSEDGEIDSDGELMESDMTTEEIKQVRN